MEKKLKISSSMALSRAQALCSKQEYSGKSMLSKVIRWGLTEKEAGDLVQRLVNEKFIDEKRFAGAFVRDRIRFYKWGLIKIRYDLRYEGIPEEIIREAEEGIDMEEYKSMVASEVQKKLRLTKENNPFKLKDKILRFAAGRGYESHIVLDILKMDD